MYGCRPRGQLARWAGRAAVAGGTGTPTRANPAASKNPRPGGWKPLPDRKKSPLFRMRSRLFEDFPLAPLPATVPRPAAGSTAHRGSDEAAGVGQPAEPRLLDPALGEPVA